MYGETKQQQECLCLQRLIPKLGSIGIPIPGGKFEIRSSEEVSFTDSNGFVNGELIYHGDNVFMGYASAISDLASEPEFQKTLPTGDIAYCDHDGYYYITGRKSRFAKLFGKRISLNDLESLLREPIFVQLLAMILN